VSPVSMLNMLFTFKDAVMRLIPGTAGRGLAEFGKPFRKFLNDVVVRRGRIIGHRRD
jgi:hypothetical protein